ncbi:hypothetical protein D3C84_1058680 [compost metagenome]
MPIRPLTKVTVYSMCVTFSASGEQENGPRYPPSRLDGSRLTTPFTVSIALKPIHPASIDPDAVSRSTVMIEVPNAVIR